LAGLLLALLAGCGGRSTEPRLDTRPVPRSRFPTLKDASTPREKRVPPGATKPGP
jgi:hypothetical protein